MMRRNVEPKRWSITPWCAPAMCLVILCCIGGRPAWAQGLTLTLSNGVGLPGGTAEVTLSLSGDTGQAVGAGLYVLFPAGTLGALDIDPPNDCTLAARLSGTHLLGAQRLLGLPPGGQGFDLEVSTNPPMVNLLGNGDLATCVFHIPAEAALGVITLATDSVLVSDTAAKILPATGVNGAVTIVSVLPTSTPTNSVTPTSTPTGPTPTVTPTGPTPTSTPTGPTATKTATGLTATPTVTPTATPTVATSTPTTPPSPTRTNTPTAPTATPTNTSGAAPSSHGGGGGCSIAAADTAHGGMLILLVIPALLLISRRRAGS